MNTFLEMTNAVKASIIAVVNALLGLLTSFGVDFTDAQQGSIVVFVNAVLALWVLLTYKNSHKRVEENSTP